MAEIALITGATGGLGRAFAEKLAERGTELILTARNEASLSGMAHEIGTKHGVTTHIFPADLTAQDAASRLAEAIKAQCLSPDILINNAGFGDFGDFASCDLARQQDMISVNIRALTALTRLFLPDMVKRGQGRVLNLASMAAFAPGPHMSVYYASKAYVLSLSRALAVELKASGVTVTALCPGPTETGFEQNAGLKGKSKLFAMGVNLNARQVAECGIDAMYRGKVVAVPGLAYKTLGFLSHIVPQNLCARAMGRLQRAVRG